MTSPATLRFLTFLTLAAPACGSETSDTSPGSSTSAGSATADSSGAGDPTEADADTAGASTSTTGGMTGDPTTGGSIADCDFDPAIVFSRDALVYQLESEDGATCVWLERRDDSEPDVIYKAVPYTLREWKSGHAGVVVHVTDLTAMTWESTHHNWNDVATASDGAVRYRLEDWYTFDDAFEARFGLYAYDADTDALLWGPITMLPYQQ